jgi:hypothetical protein
VKQTGAWNFYGAGVFLAMGVRNGLRVDLLGVADKFTANSFTDTTNIFGSLFALNYGTQTLIESDSFSSIEGTLLGGGDLTVTADGVALVNGVRTNIMFTAEVMSGVPSFEIIDTDTGATLAGGEGEPDRSGFELTITA